MQNQAWDNSRILSMEKHQQARDINQSYVGPKMKFDTIYDEYIEKQKQYDHLRQAATT